MIRAICVLLLLTSPAMAKTFETSAGPVEVVAMAEDLDQPWAVTFLPGGAVLVTERDGQLLHIGPDGARGRVGRVPDVYARGQGGLLDVVAARDFATTREIFLTYSRPTDDGAQTALAVARLSADAAQLEDLRVIFKQVRPTDAGRHFGSRVVEAPDGTLFVTIGDRGDRDQAQASGVHNGKIVRIARDGTIPADNPFLGTTMLPEVWSLGHRNPQGAALDGDGQLWTVEHGASGGDEVNRPEPGKNYGWPVISYGQHYSGGQIGIGQSGPGMEQPAWYWDPSIAPSGMMIYSGKLWPDWQGDIFVGSLKFDLISRLEHRGGSLTREEHLFAGEFIRIRDIREAPDGTIWFLAVGDGALYRMSAAP